VSITADELRAKQAPLKEKYKADPASAADVLRARGVVSTTEIAVTVETAAASGGGTVVGLHPATGGSGKEACSGDMLLQALVGCAGVTLRSVSTVMGIALRKGVVLAEGDLDWRGTLGVSKEVAVGFTAVRLKFELDCDATDEQLAKLVSLTERYCVVAQTIRAAVPVTSSHARA
jgi:uncharacterized OsmC-like protein